MIETVIIITCLLFLIIATGYDIKWKYVPDYASYSFIVIAVIERALYSIELMNLNVLLWALPSTAVLGGLGYIFYKTGMWGGGDVKILASIAILLAWFPGETIPLFLDFFVNLMIIGAFYGLPAALIKGLIKGIRPDKKESIQIIMGLISGIVVYSLLPSLMSLLLGFSIIFIFSLGYFKKIEKKGFIGEANMKTLMDGDWLVEKVKVGKKVIKPRKEGLTKEEAEQIKKWWQQGKLKKKPLIKEGIAYLPAFLISFIVTLLIGNIMLIVLTEGYPNAAELISLLS
jgi:Flp pilus assembly protein protease CpaA